MVSPSGTLYIPCPIPTGVNPASPDLPGAEPTTALHAAQVDSWDPPPPASLDGAAPTVSSLDAVRDISAAHDRDVRVFRMPDDGLVLVRHADNAHIATLAGDALAYALGDESVAEAGAVEHGDQCAGGPKGCERNSCLTVQSCGKGCTVCYRRRCR
jgi:hypothetical protein